MVLIGGGHSHVAVIKSFGMKPMPGVRLTIISRDVHTPIPGCCRLCCRPLSIREVHIDLRPLAQFAGARLYHDEALRIDTINKTVICKGRPAVPYDVLSINIDQLPDWEYFVQLNLLLLSNPSANSLIDGKGFWID